MHLAFFSTSCGAASLRFRRVPHDPGNILFVVQLKFIHNLPKTENLIQLIIGVQVQSLPGSGSAENNGIT